METLTTHSRVTRDFPPDARYLIGVSGGSDSVALLHRLVSLGYERLIVCHLNHLKLADDRAMPTRGL